MKVPRKRTVFLQEVRKLTIPVRLYALGAVSFLLGLISILTRLSLVIWSFIFLAAFFFASGFLLEAIHYIGSIWDSKFAKFLVTLFGLLSIVGLWTAKTLSLKMINSVIPVDPSYFPLSSQALTYLIVVILWLVLALLFFMFVHLGTAFWSFIESEEAKQSFSVLVGSSSVGKPLSKEKSISPDKSLLLTWRAMGALVIVVIIFFLIDIPFSHLRESISFVRTLIAQTDHYAHSTCSNYNPSAGERVAFLDGNRISVAIPDKQFGYTFEIRECEP